MTDSYLTDLNRYKRPDIELRHFLYFVAVAEALHFGRAAERLHMAQPPLSQQIRQLEETLGVRLLERTHRRVSLTSAGAAFLEEARRALRHAEVAVDVARQASRGERGRLEIGFVSSAPFNVLPGILRAYRARCPNVKLVLHEVGTASQLQAVAEGRLDAGFVRLPAQGPGVQVESVLREPLVVALPEGHRLASRRRVRIADLAGEGFIMFPREVGPGLHDRIVGLCSDAGFSVQVSQEIAQMHGIVALVAAGLGIALVPESLRHVRARGLVYRPLEGKPTVEMGLARAEGPPSPTLERFLEVVRGE